MTSSEKESMARATAELDAEIDRLLEDRPAKFDIPNKAKRKEPA
jgi:hypothetical protein